MSKGASGSSSNVSPTSRSIRVLDVIRKKRDGDELSREEIEALVNGYTCGDVPDYQASAWLMAAFLRGLSRAETVALTDAMLHSGQVLDFSDLPAAKVDKHSTGGVGDKTSLVLAPLVAAAGVYVPMISGRGLGHTGGTLDKLESIAGFQVGLPIKRFREVLDACGCCMIGQTAEIAPADRKFYALRDVTGTVEQASLICASIMSKKLAEGIDGLVLDVKTGTGAFMKTEQDASLLADLLTDTGKRMGKQVVALITDMDQPLGVTVGNAIEVDEAIAVLNGKGPEDLRELCLQLGAWMLVVGKRASAFSNGREIAEELLGSGKALAKFREMVVLQGGDPELVDNPTLLPRARRSTAVLSDASGYVSGMRCEDIGTACVILGGGREKKEDAVDPAVGIRLHKKVSDSVARGEPLCTIFYNDETRAERAKQLLQRSFEIGEAIPEPQKLVRRIIADGI